MKQTIAIVEDDEQQRRYYADALRANDYLVQEYENRQDAIAAFTLDLPDLVILDIMLQAEAGAGYDVCRHLQQRDASLPVIFLTSRGDELDKIYGLQLGAWDYQTKPVSLQYLVARIESFFQIKSLSESADKNAESCIVGALKLNAKSYRCYWREKEINLTPTEFSILLSIVESEQGVSVDDLINVTRQGVVEENTISTHILHIRKKFKQADENFQCIQTRYGFGYQWICR